MSKAPILTEGAAIRQVWCQLPENRFVLKTDVKSYYASIDHALLIDLLAEQIHDRRLRTLISRYLHRTVEDGGLFWEFGRGIPLRCHYIITNTLKTIKVGELLMRRNKRQA